MTELKNNLLFELINFCSSNKIQRLEEMFEGELAVMAYLLTTDKVTATDISLKFNVSKARVTAIVTSLIKKEFLFVEKDKEDARKSLIKLSFNGKKYIENKLNDLDLELINFLEKFGYEKSKILVELLQEVNSLLKEGEI